MTLRTGSNEQTAAVQTETLFHLQLLIRKLREENNELKFNAMKQKLGKFAEADAVIFQLNKKRPQADSLRKAENAKALLQDAFTNFATTSLVDVSKSASTRHQVWKSSKKSAEYEYLMQSAITRTLQYRTMALRSQLDVPQVDSRCTAPTSIVPLGHIQIRTSEHQEKQHCRLLLEHQDLLRLHSALVQ